MSNHEAVASGFTGGTLKRRLTRMEFAAAMGGLTVAGGLIAGAVLGPGGLSDWIGFAWKPSDVRPDLPDLGGVSGWIVAAACLAWGAAYLSIMAMRFRDMGLPGWGPALFAGFLVGAGGTVIAPVEVAILQGVILALLVGIASQTFQWGAPD